MVLMITVFQGDDGDKLEAYEDSSSESDEEVVPITPGMVTKVCSLLCSLFSFSVSDGLCWQTQTGSIDEFTGKHQVLVIN